MPQREPRLLAHCQCQWRPAPGPPLAGPGRRWLARAGPNGCGVALAVPQWHAVAMAGPGHWQRHWQPRRRSRCPSQGPTPESESDSESRLARAPGWAQRHLRLAAARPGLAEGGRTGGGT